ncbi:MAG: radical SAM protein [Polyangiales bacterium]
MSGSEVRLNLFHGDRLEYRFCTPQWRATRRPAPWRELLAALDDVDPKRCQRLLLGESPLEHPELHALLDVCRARGIAHLAVETDPASLAPDGVVEDLAARGVEKLFVVSGGLRRRVHEQVLQAPGTFDDAMRGLRRAAAGAPQLYVVVPVLRWTEPDVDPLLDALLALPGKVQGLLLSVPEVAQVPEVMRRVLLPHGALARVAARAFAQCQRVGVERGFSVKRGVLPCAADGALDRFGGVFFDRMTYLKHAPAEPFARVAACEACSLSQSCPGVEPAYLEAFGADALRPIPLEVSMDWNLKRANRLEQREFKNVSDFDNDVEGNGRALLRINGHCNMSCAFCFVDRTVPDFDEADLLSQIERMAARDPSHLVLSGGEPTLHPALPRLIARATELGFREVEIQTNGVKAADADYAKALVDAGLSKVTVSLHSVDPERSDKITRLTGGFAKTVAAMHNFRDLGVRTQVAHVITKANHAELLDTVRFLRTQFPEREGHLSICFGVAQPISDLVYTWVMPTFTEIKPHMKAALDECLAHGVGFGGMIGQGGYPPCMLDGDLRYYEGNLGNIYRSADYAEQFYKAERCRACSFDPYCLGVRRLYVETYGDAELTPFTASLDALVPPAVRPMPSAPAHLVPLRRSKDAPRSTP